MGGSRGKKDSMGFYELEVPKCGKTTRKGEEMAESCAVTWKLSDEITSWVESTRKWIKRKRSSLTCPKWIGLLDREREAMRSRLRVREDWRTKITKESRESCFQFVAYPNLPHQFWTVFLGFTRKYRLALKDMLKLKTLRLECVKVGGAIKIHQSVLKSRVNYL